MPRKYQFLAGRLVWLRLPCGRLARFRGSRLPAGGPRVGHEFEAREAVRTVAGWRVPDGAQALRYRVVRAEVFGAVNFPAAGKVVRGPRVVYRVEVVGQTDWRAA